jgi:hypothetical protein
MPMPVQSGTHVSNAHTHVSKVPDVRAFIGMQDVWACSIVNAYKACRHAATVRP